MDAVRASEKSTWEKAVELAVFVAENIPHDNQKVPLEKRNAITLWEYSRRVKSGFNCRWHSILLSELLLSAGIQNRFVTCSPESRDDGDCHVVNIVWLPEDEKWVMIDSDMTEYVTGDGGKVLSLKEMREYIRAGKEFTVNALPGFEASWLETDFGREYMQAYWAKNLYWFAEYTACAFDLEAGGEFGASYVCLVPPGYDWTHKYPDTPAVTNDSAFWAH